MKELDFELVASGLSREQEEQLKAAFSVHLITPEERLRVAMARQ